MKKILKSAMVIAASALLLVSCNEEDATPVPSPSGSANVSGFVFYDNDLTDNDDDGEVGDVDNDIPVGATVQITTYLTVNNGEFDFTEGAEAVVRTTTVASDGSYSFTIPTNADGADYEIRFFDYEGTLTFEFDDNGDEEEATESGFFSGFEGPDGTLFPSEIKFESIETYSSDDFESNDPLSKFDDRNR